MYYIIKKENIDITQTKVYKHLSNLCNNNSDILDYTLKFLARKLQKPYKLTTEKKLDLCFTI